MTYPTELRIHRDSADAEAIEGVVISRATNNAARAARLGPDKWRFRFEHRAIDATRRGVLEAFHAANADLSFDFVWPVDGQTYTCLFAGRPRYKPVGAGLVTAFVRLEEV